jgi:hypothetical protein
MIQSSGMVRMPAAMFSRQRLQVTTKSDNDELGPWNIEIIIGEQKANYCTADFPTFPADLKFSSGGLEAESDGRHFYPLKTTAALNSQSC